MLRPRSTPFAALLALTLLMVPALAPQGAGRVAPRKFGAHATRVVARRDATTSARTIGAALEGFRKYNRPQAVINAMPRPQVLVVIPVKSTINGAPNQPLGSIDAGLTGNCMEATFTLDPAASVLCEWYEFHWIQVIDSDDCSAQVAGVDQPFSQLDPPKYGWDYMYNDTDGNPGIGAGDRNPGGGAPTASDPQFADDINDTDPWYHTASEEDTDFDICDTYPINDCPAYCDPPGKTSFSTYLVATPKYGSSKQICVLAGYTWSLDNRPGHADAPPAPLVIDDIEKGNVNQALGHGGMTGWHADADCDLTCTPIDLSSHTYRVDPSPEQVVTHSSSGTVGYGSVAINVLTNTMVVDMTMGQLTGTETFAAIYGPANPGSNAPMLFPLPLGEHKTMTWNYPQFMEPAILSGQTYVGVQSTAFPQGEIRGQIVNANPVVQEQAVPGLGGWRLVALGGALVLGGVWVLARRRREVDEAA
jgi:hypothetical protein